MASKRISFVFPDGTVLMADRGSRAAAHIAACGGVAASRTRKEPEPEPQPEPEPEPVPEPEPEPEPEASDE